MQGGNDPKGCGGQVLKVALLSFLWRKPQKEGEEFGGSQPPQLSALVMLFHLHPVGIILCLSHCLCNLRGGKEVQLLCPSPPAVSSS